MSNEETIKNNLQIKQWAYDYIQAIQEELKQIWTLVRNLEEKQKLIDYWQKEIFKKLDMH